MKLYRLSFYDENSELVKTEEIEESDVFIAEHIAESKCIENGYEFYIVNFIKHLGFAKLYNKN